MKSAKFQIPNTKETQKSESQAAALDVRKPPHNNRSVWSLKVGASVGFGASHLGFLVAFLLATAARPTLAQDYAMDWFTIDGGGGTSGGGNYTLSGTVGQPDTGTLTGGGYTLVGGFWPGIVVPSTGEAPTLFIQLSAQNVIISWVPATTEFTLEQTDNLSSPAWSAGPMGNPTALIPAGSGTKFYRLRKP